MNEHSNQKDKLTLDENEMIDLMQHLKKTSASIQDTVNLLKRKHELIYCSGKCDKKETTLKIPQGDHDHDIFRKDLTPLDKDLYHIKFVIEDKDIFPFEKKNQSSQSSSYYLPSKKYVYKEDSKTINYVMYIVKKAHGVIDFENPIDMVQNEHQEKILRLIIFQSLKMKMNLLHLFYIGTRMFWMYYQVKDGNYYMMNQEKLLFVFVHQINRSILINIFIGRLYQF